MVTGTLNYVYSFSATEKEENIPQNAFSLKKASLLMIPTLETVIDYYAVKYADKPEKQVVLHR